LYFVLTCNNIHIAFFLSKLFASMLMSKLSKRAKEFLERARWTNENWLNSLAGGIKASEVKHCVRGASAKETRWLEKEEKGKKLTPTRESSIVEHAAAAKECFAERKLLA
jgi:hypothetical protein